MIVNIEVPKDIYDRASEIARSQSISVAEVFAAAWVPNVEPDEQDRSTP